MLFPDLIGRELDRLRERLGRKALHILETGSIRDDRPQYKIGDGWSTLLFAGQVAEHGGSVTSIDLDTSAADRVLSARGLRGHVDLVQMHSIDYLAGLAVSGGTGLDVAYLDSANEADLILHEYLIVRRLLGSPGLLMVDDVDLDSVTVVKGHKLAPWLDVTGIPYRIEHRDGGTGVLIADLG